MNAQAAFDILALEMTIFATLLGTISIMFIFWYGRTKDRYTGEKAKTLGEKIQKILFHLSFYLFSIFIMFGFGGIFLGIWILSIFAAMTLPLSEIVLESEVVNPLLLFTSWFSLWVFFTMFYIVIILLPTIWPKVKMLKREKDQMKENDCIFYHNIKGNNECVIFSGSCDEIRFKNCDWYHRKTTTFPNGLEFYITHMNAINQARFIQSQKLHNKLIIIFTFLLAIISIIALLKSFNIF